jgi:hypothetical protein
MRSGGRASEEVPEELIELWDCMDEPETKSVDNSDRLLPMGTFYSRASPVSLFTAVYLYLKNKGIEPEVCEEKWLISFEIPDDELTALYPAKTLQT